MKKFLLIIVMSFFTIISFGQVYKYRTIDTQVGNSGFVDQDIVITWNVDQERVHIYANNETDLSLISLKKKFQTKEGLESIFDAVDDNGRRCELIFLKFDDSGINYANMQLLYSEDIYLTYRLKRE